MMELESFSFTDLIALRDELSKEYRKRMAYVVTIDGAYREVSVQQLHDQVHQEIHKRITKLIK